MASPSYPSTPREGRSNESEPSPRPRALADDEPTHDATAYPLGDATADAMPGLPAARPPAVIGPSPASPLDQPNDSASEWVRASGPALPDWLSHSGAAFSQADTEEGRDPIDVLAETYAERLRQGESPDVEAFCAQHPEWASELRLLLPTVAALERAASRPTASADNTTAASWSGSGVRTQQLGEFVLLRELGRGGMGVVFEAEQPSLGRRVALKVLPPELVHHPRRLERFEREARVAAKLHHTNIVPIFGVGESDGQHYIVMQRIEGVPMDAVISEMRLIRSTWLSPDGQARRFRKPQPQPQPQPQPKLADLKPTPLPPTAGPEDLTQPAVARSALRTGEPAPLPPRLRLQSPPLPPLPRPDPLHAARRLLGQRGLAVLPEEPTPQRLDGRAYGRRAAELALQAADALAHAHEQGTLHRDIKPGNLLLDAQGVVWVSDFGLAKPIEGDGITEPGDVVGTMRYMSPEQLRGLAEPRSDVYALGLTLYELATLTSAYGGLHRTALVDQILAGPPTPLRQVAPDLPRDLETIVEHCLAREPGQRYASAADLAEDLRRFLDDRPILARPPTIPERLGRWARRHPALAWLSALSSAASVALIVVLSVAYARVSASYASEQEQTARTQDALRQASAESARAQRVAALASDQLDAILEQFSPGDMTGSVGGLSEDGELDAAPAQMRLTPDTARLMERLLTYYREVAGQAYEGPDMRQRIAVAEARVGDIELQLGGHAKARAAFERSANLWQEAVPRDASSADQEALALRLARLRGRVAQSHLAESHYADAAREYKSAIASLEPLAERPDASAAVRLELASLLVQLGRAPRLAVGPGATIDTRRPGPLAFLESFLPSPPGGPGGPGGPGERRRSGPDGPGRPRRPLDGRPPLGEGGRPRPSDRPGDAPPDRDRDRDRPGPGRPPVQLPQLSQEVVGFIQPAEQVALLARAVTLLDTLVEQSPMDVGARRLLAIALMEQTVTRPGQALPEDASQRRTRALALLEQLHQERPDDPQLLLDLGEAAALRTPRPASMSPEERQAALRQVTRGVSLLTQLHGQQPSVPAYAKSLSEGLLRQAQLQSQVGQREEAVASLAVAEQVQARLVEASPDEPAHRVAAALTLVQLGRQLLQDHQPDDAARRLKLAVAHLDHAKTLPDPPPYAQALLRRSLEDLAEALGVLGNRPEADAVRDRLKSMSP